MVDALKIQAHIDAEISQTQLQELAGLLAQKRRELTGRVMDLEQQIVSKDDCSLADAADAASLQENRLRAGGLVEQHQRLEDVVLVIVETQPVRESGDRVLRQVALTVRHAFQEIGRAEPGSLGEAAIRERPPGRATPRAGSVDSPNPKIPNCQSVR